MKRLLVIAALAACLGAAEAAPNVRRPYIGYVCAAGGQRGTTVRIVAGGQNLRGAKRVIVSGEGVTTRVIRHQRTPWLVRSEQRSLLARTLRRLAAQQLTDPTGKRRARQPAKKPTTKKADPKKTPKKGNQPKRDGKAQPEITLPDHPMLEHLDELNPKEIRRVMYEFLDPARRSQLSGQIAEVVEIEVTIAPDAAPGDRELRIGGPLGLSNPVLFQVGLLPERNEVEPNDIRTKWQGTYDLPVVVNGQVSFKDQDFIRFRARKGQKLVIEAEARRLVPYLADAVPGWFQATLMLKDAAGREIAYGDDYRFSPDPVLFFEVPSDGEYVLEIRDSIDRGREDFVWRITIGERPFITSVFPLGGRTGVTTIADVSGWNLPWDQVLLDTQPGGPTVRTSAWRRDAWRTNHVSYGVDDLPECDETEPNDGGRSAHRIDLPRIVNGRIGEPGETDVFRFEGRKGDHVVAEVQARRLGSAVDSLLQLTDASGAVIAWNDDRPDRSAGLVTHQSDSSILATLPADGTYFVHVSDTQGQGGPDHAYRLRVGPPRPDFTLIVTPASINVPAGSTVPITVHAVRRDGFDGEIEVSLTKAPEGCVLSGGRIPAGRDKVRMTLGAAPKMLGRPFELGLVGITRIGDRWVRRNAIPATDMMQAFGLRHLVQAQDLLLDVTRSWRRTPPLRLADERPVGIPVGGTAQVRIRSAGLPPLDRVEFVLADPPAGVTLRTVTGERNELVLVLAAEAGVAKPGLADNLIVEAYAQMPVPQRGAKNKGKKGAKSGAKKPAKGKQKGKPATDKKPAAKAAPVQTRRTYIGILPAVPFRVVAR